MLELAEQPWRTNFANVIIHASTLPHLAGQLHSQREGMWGVNTQEVAESATRALELAEQRLAEAAAELQRRGAALADVAAQRDATAAEVGITLSVSQASTALSLALLHFVMTVTASKAECHGAESSGKSLQVARMKGLMRTETAQEPAKLETTHNGPLSACKEGAGSGVTEASGVKDQVLGSYKHAECSSTCICISSMCQTITDYTSSSTQSVSRIGT